MGKDIKLKVMEALQEEAYKGIVRIDSETMKDIEVRVGDIVEIEGGRKTLGIVDRAYPTDVGQTVIRMDGILRRNAKTGIGENVLVRKIEAKEAKTITLAPAQEGIMIKADGEFFKRGLLGRAIYKGDVVALGGAQRRRTAMSDSPFFGDIFNVFDEDIMAPFSFGNLKFVIVETNPKQAVVITEKTEIKVNSKAVEVVEEHKIPEFSYEDIGGLDEEIKKVREMVELPLKHPELFERLGIQPPKGVLLHGPPGTGKTLLAKAVANETDAKFLSINGPEVTSKFVGEAEKKIREVFEEAEKSAPSIIFIDEIDAIATKRDEVYGEVEKRMVSQLLTTMDGLKSRGKVIVMAATNRPNALDPALRRPGRFDREITFGIPSKEGRLNILKIHTRNMPLKHWDSGAACKILINKIDSFEENAKQKIKDKKNEIYQMNIDIKGIKEEIDKNQKWIKEIEQQEKELKNSKDNTLVESFLRKLRLKEDKQVELLRFKEQSEKNIHNLSKRTEEIAKIEADIVLMKEVQKEREKDKGLVQKIMNDIEEINRIRENLPLEDARNLLIERKRNEKDKEVTEKTERLFKTEIISKEFFNEVQKESINVMQKTIANITHGFVGADLEALCKEAAMSVIRRILPDINLKENATIPHEVLEKLQISMADFQDSMKVVSPSALREVLVEIPNVKWSDIGGLESLKQELKETVEWPLKHPHVFKGLGIRPPRGVLMYGPPGCGKTLLAKAVANESEANFILVKGPELISKWVGDSEKGIREIFKKARQSAPSIIFFDEIDAIAPRRGSHGDSSQVTERVVNQILTEMDGLEELNEVVVIAATNRPDIIDPGLLRPGRFDRIIMTTVPDRDGRLEILKIHTKNMPLGKDVDLSKLADKTDNYVGADLDALCREAAILALRENIDVKEIPMKYFDEAMKKVKSSILNEDILKYKEIEENYIRTARGAAMRTNQGQNYFG